jgi:hypothetical protein
MKKSKQLSKKSKTSTIPRGATHIKLITPDGKTALSEAKDISVFCYPFRCTGKLIFLKKVRGGFEELESLEFEGVWPPAEPQLIT